ncbi:MAG: PIN domain-containing protein [Polyangiaceae bacterium]
MRVLVDTSVWSLVLRREAPERGANEQELRELLREGRVVMMGAIRQELLSGIRAESQFKHVRGRLRAFGDIGLQREDYEEAAACFTKCRSAGVQGGSVDFLICAVALRRKLAIFTLDVDFEHYSRILGLTLHTPRVG